MVSESHVTWAISMPIFGLPRPLCYRLRPDERDRQTDVRQKHRITRDRVHRRVLTHLTADPSKDGTPHDGTL